MWTKTVKFYNQDAVYGLKANLRNAEKYRYNDRTDKDVIIQVRLIQLQI